MELADFTRLVEAYGADPKRWPAERRGDALALMKSDPGAAAILDEARSLDEVLDAAPVQAPSLVLRTAVAASALGGDRRRRAGHRSGQAGPLGRPLPRRLAAAAALAAACAAGAVTGVAAATRQVLPVRAVVSADPAVDAGRLLAEPLDAEG
jgi:hypothetical protein